MSVAEIFNLDSYRHVFFSGIAFLTATELNIDKLSFKSLRVRIRKNSEFCAFRLIRSLIPLPSLILLRMLRLTKGGTLNQVAPFVL